MLYYKCIIKLYVSNVSNYNLGVQSYTQLLKAKHQIQLNDLGTKKEKKHKNDESA